MWLQFSLKNNMGKLVDWIAVYKKDNFLKRYIELLIKQIF